MLRLERGPVHLPRQQEIILLGDTQRDAALVVLLHATLNPTVKACEEDLGHVIVQPHLLQQEVEWGARPLGCAHRASQPGLANRTGVQQGASIASAF
jgi:hypothetical protein